MARRVLIYVLWKNSACDLLCHEHPVEFWGFFNGLFAFSVLCAPKQVPNPQSQKKKKIQENFSWILPRTSLRYFAML